MDGRTAAVAILALATAMMLESVRVFASYLVFVVDQSQRVTIALVAVTVFTFPVVTALLARYAGTTRALAGALIVLAACFALLQFVALPVARLVIGGAAVVAWGVLAVIMLSSVRRFAGPGIVLGLALDLGIRAAIGPVGLAWMPDLIRNIVALLMAAGLVALWLASRDASRTLEETSWRAAAALFAVGPALALYHLLTGNVVFARVHTDFSAPAAGVLLGVGMALGALIGTLRLLAISSGGGGNLMVGRFILFDAIIGAVSLSFAWRGGDLAPLGLLFATLTATELLLLALMASERAPGEGAGRVAVMFTAGMLFQFSVLFLYYTSTGSGIMIAVAWAGLVAGAAAGGLTLPAALREQRPRLRPLALPALAIVLLLAIAPGIRALTAASPEPVAFQGDALRVMTYNIQSGFSLDNYWDLEAIAQVIEDASPDVLVLQEVSRGWVVTSGNDQLAWLSARLDMPYIWGPASTDDLWGNAVLSRIPMEFERLSKFSSTQNLRRSAVVVHLDAGPGRTVAVVATHLDNPREASTVRSEQAAQLVELLDGETPTIVAGDFNMEPDDPLMLTLGDVGFIDTAPPAGADGPTSADDRRIDYIFATQHFDVLGGEVIQSDASDHRPLVVDLAMP